MANQEHLDILKQGVEVWNQWREEHPDIYPDLSQTNLEDADLCGANLINANFERSYFCDTNLSNVNFSHAHLEDADFTGADLRGANLSRTRLDRVNFMDADLSNADLSEADISTANFISTNLKMTNFSCSRIGGEYSASFGGSYHLNLKMSMLVNIDLSSAKCLDTITHEGPSSISVDTIYLSRGNIPEIFLRGAGLPDSFIAFARSLARLPIDHFSCFISYSSKDEIFAKRLYADLQNNNVRCWFAPEDLKIGDKFRARIDEAIYFQDKLLLLLSEHALASAWVEDEVETALEKEQRQQREVLFPVRLDESVMQTSQAWAAKLRRTRHIGDFTRWTEPQAYQSAFERLLRDLKAEISKPKE